MLLTITYTNREIERLMTRIPNFRPRGYGVFVFNKFEYTAKDCDCRYCLHWQKGIGCTEGKCPYMKERITAGAVPIKEALLEALSPVNHFAFQLRLRHHIRESEENTMQFKNDKHKEAFTEAVRKMNKKDNALMAAVYLFTADGRLWNQVSRYVDRCEIAYDRIRISNTTESGYTLFCCAKDLALGTKHLTISDLADGDLISPKLFGVICNAMAIRRYRGGCETEFVCHTTSVENAVKIFESGKLLSAAKARGISAELLMAESRNAAHDQCHLVKPQNKKMHLLNKTNRTKLRQFKNACFHEPSCMALF